MFEKNKAIQEGPTYAQLSPTRQRIIENAIRDFRLGGAELSDEKKIRFAEIQEQQSALQTKFSENVLDATNAYELIITD